MNRLKAENQGYFTQCSNLTLGSPVCLSSALSQSPRALGRRCTGWLLDIWLSPEVAILGVLWLKALFHISEIGTVISLKGKEAVCLELILGWSWEFSSHHNCIDRLVHLGFRVDIHLSKNLFMPKEQVGCDPIVWTCLGHFISVNVLAFRVLDSRCCTLWRAWLAVVIIAHWPVMPVKNATA